MTSGPDTVRPPRRWRKRAFALFVSLAIAEVLLRILLHYWVRLAEPPHCGMRPEILHRLLTAYGCCGIDSRTMLADPHRGYRHAPNVVNGTDSDAPFSTNSRGARGPREYAVPKPASAMRIVALGDSFTFGQGVPDDAAWPAQLERALPGTEVVNLGERGYGHDQMLYALEDDGIPMQPDAVVLAFYEADMVRDHMTFFCSEKPRFTATADGWTVENLPVPTLEQVRLRYQLLPALYLVGRALWEIARDPSLLADATPGDPARTEEIIRRMRARAEAAGARFIMVNLPGHPEAPPDQQNFFRDYCARTGTECVDAWPLFSTTAGTTDPEALRARYQLPHDIHYSPAGYAVIAEALRQHLTERPLAPAAR